MSFTPRKYKDIFDEMRAMTQVVTDFEVGSVARTMYESFAYEMALLYEKMNLVYLSAYVDTAQGNQLDQVVAVLGIERSQPDFAEGIVSFQRDGAGQEIVIPIGTLVATEESSTGEKKVYQTSKEALLGATHTRVDVQVRGVERGEELETAAETIVVMPRPVPGIKFVINDAPIRLVGKRRETDDELRERAKNALISSGKATILSVENALLSLSGVRDARVKENFHKARAKVKLANNNNIDQIIFKGTVFTLLVGSQTVVFKSLDPVEYEINEAGGTEKEIKIESVLEGKIGEVILGTGQVTFLTFEDGALNAAFTAELLTDVRLEDFGLIEVYVDAPRIEEGTPAEIALERSRIEAEIERVRAAGIFSILYPAGKVVTSAVFKVDLSPSLSLTPEERKAFEETIEDEIMSFMSELRMGKPLLYGKLIKAILSVENIENLSDFQGTATRNILGSDLAVSFSFADADKFIAVDEFERIKPRHICVASENKELPVHIAYQSSALIGVNAETNAGNVETALKAYFDLKTLGQSVLQSEIEDIITLQVPLTAATLDLRPESWCPGPVDDPRALLVEAPGNDTEVVVTYVEKPVLGTLFGYGQRLEITGAIKLIMPLNVTQEEHLTAKQKVLEAITTLLDQLGPEEDPTFEAMVAAAQTVSQVLAAKIDPKDFQARLGGAVQPTLVDNEKIDVLLFQRAFPEYFCISSNIEKVSFSLQDINITMANGTSLTDQGTVQVAVANAWSNVLAGFKAGDDIVFANVKGALENLATGLSYTITLLELQAESLADGRVQTADMGSPGDIHIRSIELAIVLGIQPSDVIITLLP